MINQIPSICERQITDELHMQHGRRAELGFSENASLANAEQRKEREEGEGEKE